MPNVVAVAIIETPSVKHNSNNTEGLRAQLPNGNTKNSRILRYLSNV